MKVWKDWKPIQQAMQSLSKRKCWKKCNDCQKSWKENQTQMVHMIVVVDEAKKSLTRFICDNCLEAKEK